MKYTEAIREYLEESGETMDAYAKRAGISRATFFRIMLGKNNPRISSVEKILAPIGYRVEVVKNSATPKDR